jgi:hypothetical protein
LILRYVAAIFCGLYFFGGPQASGKQFDPATQDTFTRSIIYIENGEYQSAISILRNILKRDPSLNRVRLELGGLRSLGGTSIVGMSLAGLTFDASAPYESYYEIRLSPYISSDVGYGFTGTLRPSYRIAKFDATAPLFFEPREDWEAGIGLQITKNDYSIHGYSPFISYDFAYHDSNIELYQYTDHIFQVGLTKIY